MALTLQRAPLILVPLLVLTGWFFTLRPVALGGPVQYVVVVGQSMEPTLHSGDLVVIRRQDEYAVGDIVSIETPIGPVMHRIVGGNGDEGFVSQGDNNEITDPWSPTTSEIVGKLWLRFPGGANFQWAVRLTLVLGLVALGALTWYVMAKRRNAMAPGPPG